MPDTIQIGETFYYQAGNTSFSSYVTVELVSMTVNDDGSGEMIVTCDNAPAKGGGFRADLDMELYVDGSLVDSWTFDTVLDTKIRHITQFSQISQGDIDIEVINTNAGESSVYLEDSVDKSLSTTVTVEYGDVTIESVSATGGKNRVDGDITISNTFQSQKTEILSTEVRVGGTVIDSESYTVTVDGGETRTVSATGGKNRVDGDITISNTFQSQKTEILSTEVRDVGGTAIDSESYTVTVDGGETRTVSVSFDRLGLSPGEEKMFAFCANLQG